MSNDVKGRPLPDSIHDKFGEYEHAACEAALGEMCGALPDIYEVAVYASALDNGVGVSAVNAIHLGGDALPKNIHVVEGILVRTAVAKRSEGVMSVDG